MGRNGVADTTSPLNIGEEYQTSERMVNVVFVYVLNCHGQPLMPCQPRKARLLQKLGKAKVVRMVPFTLQLLYGSSGYKIERKSGGFRDATQMGIIGFRMYEQAKEMFSHVHLTYGYITKHTRIAHNLEKSHVIDARCISEHPLAVSDGAWYLMRYMRRNNRQLHKATIKKGSKRQRNTAPKYVHGFRLFDCVNYQGKCCFVFGRRSSGYFDLRTLDGVKISASASYKKLTIVQKASASLVERRAAFPPVAVISRRVSTPRF